MSNENLPVIRKSRLVRDLRVLGLEPGQVAMLHASVKAVGWIVGGPDVVLDALLEVLGPSGTLMMMVGTEDGSYWMHRWPEERQRAYREELPPFDPLRTRAYRGWSILTEYLRTRPGAVRSRHPDSSFAAIGPKAAWLTEDHPYQHGYGPGSPLARLVQADGRVLLLGSPLSDVTLLHHAEYLLDIPTKKTVRYSEPVLVDGCTQWIEMEELDSSNGIADFGVFDYFTPIVSGYIAAGGARSGHVGAASCHLLGAAGLVRYAVEWMRREYRGPFVERRGNGAE